MEEASGKRKRGSKERERKKNEYTRRRKERTLSHDPNITRTIQTSNGTDTRSTYNLCLTLLCTDCRDVRRERTWDEERIRSPNIRALGPGSLDQDFFPFCGAAAAANADASTVQ